MAMVVQIAQVHAHSCRYGIGGIRPLMGVAKDTMASRRLRTRYAGNCAACSTSVAAGSLAWWDAGTKTLRCVACEPTESTESSPPPLEPGIAGGSAQREYERRHAKREDRVRSAHPRIGGLLLAAFDDPHSTKAWSSGAEGERRAGAALDALAANGIVVLHDRRIPGTRANIDHLVVAPSGIWVIDSKNYKGKVEKRDVGGFFRRDERLFVGNRDCSKLLAGVERQVEVVRAAVSNLEQPPVIPVLCFVDAEWGLFTKPFRVNEVLVTWPKALTKAVQSTSLTLQQDDVQAIAAGLATALPPA